MIDTAGWVNVFIDEHIEPTDARTMSLALFMRRAQNKTGVLLAYNEAACVLHKRGLMKDGRIAARFRYSLN